jgi:type IV secretory pathway TrbD component
MSYRPRPTFDKPTAETVQRSRPTMGLILPLIILQQSMVLFGHDSGRFEHILGVVAWGCVTFSLLWWLLGLPFRWLSKRDLAILNDERSRVVGGDAARWGIVTLAVCGFGMLIAQFWFPLDTGIAIFGLVNAALVVTFARLSWLNRAEPDEDE